LHFIIWFYLQKFFFFLDSYPKARIKLSRAVETQEKIKRKRTIPNRFHNSSSEPDESDAGCFLPSPPKIYHSKKYKNDICKKNQVAKYNQDIKLARTSSRNSISMIDSLPKQKSNNFEEKSHFLQKTSHISMPLRKSTESTSFINKMKDKQYDISDDSISFTEIESSVVTSQINHSPHNFDNINYEKHSPILSMAHNMDFNSNSSLSSIPYIQKNCQVSESQLTTDCTEQSDCTKKNDQSNKSLPRNAAKRLFSYERSSKHHISPKHFVRSNNNTKSNIMYIMLSLWLDFIKFLIIAFFLMFLSNVSRNPR